MCPRVLPWSRLFVQKQEIKCFMLGVGEGGTRPIFEYRWAAEGLKPVYLEYKENSSGKSNQLCRQYTYPVPGSQLVGKTRKWKVRAKLAGREKCWRFLNWADPTISEPGTGNNLLTDSHEIIYPVWDREDKNHTLSSGTSPYRPYKGIPLPGGWGGDVSFLQDNIFSKRIGKRKPLSY